MNISKTVSGVKILPSFKLWWNKYNLKVEIKGNHLVHDAMLIKEIYDFQNNYCWDTMKFSWNRHFTVYFADNSVAKKFITTFSEYILKAQGVRTQDELDIINSSNKLLRSQLFFNKYRYMTYKIMPSNDYCHKLENLNMDARISTTQGRWKTTIYMSNKKDVAKLQLSLGKTEQIYKVVTIEEL
tara:strand:- start:192 stop:743 length:552 start_codon:yes stop_codon:yes gene_type:complete